LPVPPPPPAEQPLGPEHYNKKTHFFFDKNHIRVFWQEPSRHKARRMSANSYSEWDRQHAKAVKQAIEHLNSASRTQVVMATGTGKTRVGALIADRLCVEKQNARFVCAVLAPRGELLWQTVSSWAKSMPRPFDFVCVGGSASDRAEFMKRIDDIPVAECASGERPRAADVDVTSVERAAQSVRAWLAQNQSQRLFVVLSTYHSVGCLAAFESIDLCIYDEAHRTVSVSDADGDGLFQKTLTDRQSVGELLLPTITMRLFLTATRRVGADRGMDANSNLFGEVAFTLTYARAVELGLICPLQVEVLIVRRSDVDNVLPPEITDEASRKAAAVLFATSTLLSKFDCTRAIVACESIEEVLLVGQTGNRLDVVRRALGNSVQYMCVTADTGGKARREVIDQLKSAGHARIVCANYRVLGEGIDVERLDAVIVARTIDSVVEIVQLLGRAVRKHENKTRGFVFVPVYVDSGGDPGLCVQKVLRTLSTVLCELTAGGPEVAQVVRQRSAKLALPTSNAARIAASSTIVPLRAAENDDDADDCIPVDAGVGGIDESRDEIPGREVDQDDDSGHNDTNGGDSDKDSGGDDNERPRPIDLSDTDEDSILAVAELLGPTGCLTTSSMSYFEILELEGMSAKPASCRLLAPALVRRPWFAQFIKYARPQQSQADKDARSKWLSGQRRRNNLLPVERVLLTEAGLLRPPDVIDKNIARLKELGIRSLQCSKDELLAKGLENEEARQLNNWMKRQVTTLNNFLKDRDAEAQHDDTNSKSRKNKKFAQFRRRLKELIDAKFVTYEAEDEDTREEFGLVEDICFDGFPTTSFFVDSDDKTPHPLLPSATSGDASQPNAAADAFASSHTIAIQGDGDQLGTSPVDMQIDDINTELADGSVSWCHCETVRSVDCLFDRLFHDYDELALDLSTRVRQQIQRHFSLTEPAGYERHRWAQSPVELELARRAVH
jgi:superfamily II DNA or RNA helicase